VNDDFGGKPASAMRNRLPLRTGVRFTQKPRSNFSDGFYPKNLDVVGARSAQWLHSAQAVAKLARTEAVRADRRLRKDDEAILAQSTILG